MAFQVTPTLYPELAAAIKSDSNGIYFKSILSIAEALNAISRGYHSWAVVKLYYSVFYLVRFLFAVRGIAFLKCSGIFSLQIKDGMTPIKRDCGKFEEMAIKGDHKTLLVAFMREYGNTEKILSNNLDGKTPIQWMMSEREAVNYRDVSFFEPDFEHFYPGIKSDGLDHWVNIYLSDENFIYCFLPEHCSLATALKLTQQCAKEFASKNSDSILSDEQRKTIEGLMIGTCMEKVSLFHALYS